MMNLNTTLKRALYNSPLHRTVGQIALAAILILLFVFALSGFQRYYLTQPLQMGAGLAVATILYLPTILVLYFLDRREREAKLFLWGVPLSIIFFFGPVASTTLHTIRDATVLSDWQFVGFVEEPIKILPLLLLLLFARPAVNGVRDGLIYGALGGLGFAILESAAYFALLDYPERGWSSIYIESLSRASLLGVDIHILFSATVGAAIGYGVSTRRHWLGILAIIGVFTLVALTHGQQDHALGKMLGVGGVVISGSVVAALAGVPLEQTDQLQGTPWGYLMLSMGSTIAMLSINLINLIILFVAVWKSGDTERRTVLTQLTNQPQSVVTPAELAGVKAERRLHLRTVPGYPQKTARKIRSLQNELAFRQDFLQRRGDALENDPPSAVLKQLIEAERANPIS